MVKFLHLDHLFKFPGFFWLSWFFLKSPSVLQKAVLNVNGFTSTRERHFHSTYWMYKRKQWRGYKKELLQLTCLLSEWNTAVDYQLARTRTGMQSQEGNMKKNLHGLFVYDKTTASANTTTKSDEAKEDKIDDVYNYAVARLSLGLLIRCVDDAIREGNGDRIILCWRFFLSYCKAFNHNKYALPEFLLLAYVTALLLEAKSHSLIWNRTVSNKGGKGKICPQLSYQSSGIA